MRSQDAPADTTMMRIVHDALRRDLARAVAALEDPATAPHTRRAVGGHLEWMMQFLHAHHASEDNGLYPFVRARATDGDIAVLDRMHSAHDAVAVAMDRVGQAAVTLAADPSAGAVAAARAEVAELETVLLPHLRDEEDTAMPIVSKLITAAEWMALEQQYNLDQQSKAQLGFTGHWLIDGASVADRAAVLALVPPVPRFFLLHGYARRYRRHAAACWSRTAAPRHVQAANEVSVVVDAAIDDVWEVVRDVTRVGEWSKECVGAEWVGAARTAVPGERFRGRNRAGIFRWGRVCEVVTAAPYELVWRTVPTKRFPDSSEWRIALEAADGRTRIMQSFRVLRAPKVLAVLYALMIPSHRDRTTELVADLNRLGAVASGSPAQVWRKSQHAPAAPS